MFPRRATAPLQGVLPAFLRGFTLVEVMISLGIVAFAMVSLMGMLPFGLNTFKQAMSNTVESQIVQGMANDILLTDFANLTNQTCLYDYDGRQLASSNASAIYRATVTLESLTNLQSFPIRMQSSSAGNEGYNVKIEIFNYTQPNRTNTYSLIIANNN